MANPLKVFSSTFLDILEIVVVALSIFLVVYLFFMQPHQVSGESMQPTLMNQEYVLTDKVSYQVGLPQRGDVIVFHAPASAGCSEGTGCDFIKRVLAVPGDTISFQSNGVVVNGQTLIETYLPEGRTTPDAQFTRGGRVITLGPDEYFAVGDNRHHSSDSRAWGPITRSDIVGRAFFRYWPLETAGFIPRVREVF